MELPFQCFDSENQEKLDTMIERTELFQVAGVEANVEWSKIRDTLVEIKELIEESESIVSSLRVLLDPLSKLEDASVEVLLLIDQRVKEISLIKSKISMLMSVVNHMMGSY